MKEQNSLTFVTERIEDVRMWTNLSVPQFCEKIGFPYKTYTSCKTGRTQPSLELVIRVLDFYKCINPDFLLLKSDDMMRPEYEDDGFPKENSCRRRLLKNSTSSVRRWQLLKRH